MRYLKQKRALWYAIAIVCVASVAFAANYANVVRQNQIFLADAEFASTATVSGDLDIKSGGDLDVESGGDIAVASGGDIEVASGGDIALASGASIEAASGSDVALSGSINVGDGGTINLASGGLVAAAAGSAITISQSGEFNHAGETVFTAKAVALTSPGVTFSAAGATYLTLTADANLTGVYPIGGEVGQVVVVVVGAGANTIQFNDSSASMTLGGNVVLTEGQYDSITLLGLGNDEWTCIAAHDN